MDLFVVPASLSDCLRTADHGQPATILWLGASAPDGGMDRRRTDGGLWVGATPSLLIRDRDTCYGYIFVRRVRSLGIAASDLARSPWQNGYAERLIGSIRRECLDILL